MGGREKDRNQREIGVKTESMLEDMVAGREEGKEGRGWVSVPIQEPY